MTKFQSFGEYLKWARNKEKLTYEALKAKGITTPIGLLNQYEKGSKYPADKTLSQLCKALKHLDKASSQELIRTDKQLFKTRQILQDKNIFLNILSAKNPMDILEPKTPNLKNSELKYNNELLRSLVFAIEGNFLEPFIFEGQRAICSYRHELNTLSPKDKVILSFKCFNRKYTNAIEQFKQKTHQDRGCIIVNAVDDILGEIQEISKTRIKICGLLDKKISVEIDRKDFVLAAKIVGVLF